MGPTYPSQSDDGRNDRSASQNDTDAATTQARIEPLAPTDLRKPELLTLGMIHKEYKIAREGFLFQLTKYWTLGISVRDLAAACGLKPRDIRNLLKEEGLTP